MMVIASLVAVSSGLPTTPSTGLSPNLATALRNERRTSSKPSRKGLAASEESFETEAIAASVWSRTGSSSSSRSALDCWIHSARSRA